MRVESVSVAEALSHADTLEISYHSLTRVLWNPWKAEDRQAIEAIRQTFTYKIIEVQHINFYKTARTQIIFSPETPLTLYNYIYLEDNTTYGAKCQYPTNRNIAESLQENAISVFGLRLYNSLPKYLRDIKSVKT